MEHEVTLNIHYSSSDKVWEEVEKVYRSMPYFNCAGYGNGSIWTGKDIDLDASVEPVGIVISGTMPDTIWEVWYASLKEKLTAALGYEIGEPEDGYEMKIYD